MPSKKAFDTDLERFMTYFHSMQLRVYATTAKHGFHEQIHNRLDVPTKLALIMSEASEALDAHRKGQFTNLRSELADIVIRTMDLAGTVDIDLAYEIVKKALFNSSRAFKHGNNSY